MIRFDTRKKKPKLYHLAALSAVEAAVIVTLLILGGQKFTLAVSISLIAYLSCAVLMLINSFFKQLQYNPYSYNTLYYSGFALFVLSVLGTHIYVTVLYAGQINDYTVRQIILTLLNSAKNYMFLTSPFILVFSLALCVSNLSLIRHEGKRLVNLLGILLSFLLLSGEAFLFLFEIFVPEAARQHIAAALPVSLFAAVFLYFECMIVGAIIAGVVVVRYEPEHNKDFLIILGCGLRSDGTPTPILRGRIDRALAFAQKQKAETGRDIIFVTSGGQGPDEVCSESESMKRYLLEHGVAEDRILEENQSRSTFENMQFSKKKILERSSEGRIAFSTTNYHVFRSGLYARRVKMRAVGMGAPTRWYFWPNAWVRELVGLVTDHRLKQALIFGGMIAVYVTLAILSCL